MKRKGDSILSNERKQSFISGLKKPKVENYRQKQKDKNVQDIGKTNGHGQCL